MCYGTSITSMIKKRESIGALKKLSTPAIMERETANGGESEAVASAKKQPKFASGVLAAERSLQS